jgi:hypothetical protein
VSMFLDCPAYLDAGGSIRCGLPADIKCRYIAESTCGPMESAMIRCPVGHFFNGPVESLILATPRPDDFLAIRKARTGDPRRPRLANE